MNRSAQIAGDKWKMLESYGATAAVGSVLSFWAGSVNSLTTISILFDRSSHVSGRIADIGINLFQIPINITVVAVIWLSFVVGSYFAGILLDRIGLTRSLIFQSICIFGAALVTGAGIAAAGPDDYGVGRMLMAFILPFAMGFQNSLTSQLPLERTTHWTGASTDLGISLAKGLYPMAIFICVKITAFIIGAAVMAYLIEIVRMPPFYGLFIISFGLLLTTFICDKANKRFLLLQPVTKPDREI